MAIKFFWNGIKGADGKLQRAWYSDGPWNNLPSDCITIYARNYRRFSKEVAEAFAIENNTDLMTDYFENDKIRVFPTHALFADVKAAVVKAKAHHAAVVAKRAA